MTNKEKEKFQTAKRLLQELRDKSMALNTLLEAMRSESEGDIYAALVTLCACTDHIERTAEAGLDDIDAFIERFS